MYDENEPFESYDEEYEQWLDDIQASADADIADQQFEHDFALEAGKLSAGAYDRPDNLAQFTKANFKNVWSRSLSKADRENEMARAMA